MTDTEVSDNSQRLQAVFDEDVVQSKDKKKIGIVVKTTRDDDSDEDSDSSEFEEDKVEEGQLMVAWYKTNNRWNDDDEVKVVNEDTVNLVDRSLLHGDIIRWVDKSKGTQKGQIKEVIVVCDLKIVGTNHVLRNVNAKKLLPLQNFVPYIPVVKGAWLGYIQEVWMELTVRLKNNSRCIISGTNVNSLHDVTDQRDEESTYYCTEFYRGQQVRGPASVFKDAKWIVGLRPAVNNQRSIKAVVEEIRVEKIRVDWQVCGFTGDQNNSLVQPDAIIPSTQLSEVITLNHFKEASITIGDKALYTLTEHDQEKFKLTKNAKASASEPVDKEAEKEEASKQDADESSDDSDDNEAEPAPVRTSHLLRGGRRTVSRPRRPPCRNTTAAKRKKRFKPTVSLLADEKVCVEVVLTKTMANVVWQRGDLQENIPSTELYPVLHLDELEFFPGDFVNDKREDQKNHDNFGVVQTADFNNRICSIRWLQFVNDVYESDGHIEENVSVYDIADHKDYSFRAGDVVVRLATLNEPETSNEGISVPPAGEVVKVDLDGLVTVLWSDESTSSILPSRLYVLDKEDDEDIDFDADMNSDDDDGSDNSGEWETASDRSDEGIPFIETEEGIPNIESEEGVPNIESGDVIPFIEGMLGAEGQMDPLEDVIMRSLAALNSGNRNTPSNNEHVIGRDRRTEDFINALDSMFDRDVELENNEEAEEAANTENESKAKGRLFTTEHAPNTHHFINTVSAPHNLRAFHGAVSRDIKLLKAHLPLGIFVKCFEDRMDLLSLLVVGPSGTPYEDGLFYFDLQLPDGYPAVPPKVFYYSYCSARLNPNLYEEGKVCVSLLGTWTGKGSETWTTKSTLHQLFVSIQGLILNAEPYFNEAGFEKQKGTEEGIENSRMYNEMATIKMLQTMQKMVSRPPEIFSEEVTSHFKTAIPRVVKRMKYWLDSEQMDNKTEPRIEPLFPLLPLSKGFRGTVTRLLEKLEKLTFPMENDRGKVE